MRMRQADRRINSSLQNHFNGEIKVSSKAIGTIKFFNRQKGFGFIAPDSGGKDLFVHANGVVGDADSLREGDKVSYEEQQGRKGPEAVNVSKI